MLAMLHRGSAVRIVAGTYRAGWVRSITPTSCRAPRLFRTNWSCRRTVAEAENILSGVNLYIL
jgi:hypothetical protein